MSKQQKIEEMLDNGEYYKAYQQLLENGAELYHDYMNKLWRLYNGDYVEEDDQTEILNEVRRGVRYFYDDYTDSITTDSSEDSSDDSDYREIIDEDKKDEALYFDETSDFITNESNLNSQRKRLSRAKKTELRFFNLERCNPNQQRETNTEKLMGILKGEENNNVVNIYQQPIRTTILTQTGAFNECTKDIEPSDLCTLSDIEEKTEWVRTGNNNSSFWSRVKYKRSGIEYKWQSTAVPGNLTNLLASGVGRYGEGYAGRIPNILTLINSYTEKNFEREKKLAKLILQNMPNGNNITDTMLENAGMCLHDTAQNRKTENAQFNKAVFLIVHHEVARRKFQGGKIVNGEYHATPELPFGIAIAMALKLIAHGFLRMTDVFNDNAPYGVFSGQQILSTERNIKLTTIKFQKLFSKYIKSFHHNSAIDDLLEDYPKGEQTLYRETLHQLLLETFGGSDESDGDSYESSDEKAENRRKTL